MTNESTFFFACLGETEIKTCFVFALTFETLKVTPGLGQREKFLALELFG